MKILLDSCVWGGACKELSGYGYDVVWAGNWSKDPGDKEILQLANKENRVLITLDKDFGELAILDKIPHAGIIRLVNLPARKQAIYCHKVIEKYKEEIRPGAIITVEQDRVRIRPPE